MKASSAASSDCVDVILLCLNAHRQSLGSGFKSASNQISWSHFVTSCPDLLALQSTSGPFPFLQSVSLPLSLVSLVDVL